MSLSKEEKIEILQNEIETLKRRLERKEKELEELKDDFEKHLHGNKDGILYHHYCKKCGFDWWSEEAFPNRCSKCRCELI